MAERTRRTKKEIINDKIAKAKADIEKYQSKIDEANAEIKDLENQLNDQRKDEVMAAITESGITIDQAIAKIKA